MPHVSTRRVAALALAVCAAAPAAAQPLSRLQIADLASTSLDESGLGAARSMAVVPDVTGDGVADLALGASQEDNARGRVYVYNAAARAVVRVIASPQSVQAERFGSAVAGLPDLDGDGRGEIAVGAVAATVGGLPGAGRVYVFSGATGALLRTLTSPNAVSGGRFGFALASVPDRDGDGVADLGVGAPDENAPDAQGVLRVNVGRAYVFSGATGALVASPVSLNPDEFFPGPFGGIRGSDFGFALAGLGDVDGDGRGELVVGAPGEWTGDFDADPAPYDGRVYTSFSGAPLSGVLRSPNAENRGGFGVAVAATPDLDGDGRPDVLVGAYDESLSNANDDEGRAYLVSGATGVPLRAFVSPEPSDESDFGAAVGVVPDLNRNGVAELFITEPTTCCDKMPAVYVFEGQSSGLLYSVELPDITWDLNEVVGLPDVDGDGRGDLALGVTVGTFDGVDRVLLFSGDLSRNEVEPNDNRAEATRLAGTSPRVVEGYAGGSDDAFNGGIVFDDEFVEDLFRVDLTAPGLEVALAGLTDDVDLYVLRPDLTLVGQSIQPGTAAESLRAC